MDEIQTPKKPLDVSPSLVLGWSLVIGGVNRIAAPGRAAWLPNHFGRARGSHRASLAPGSGGQIGCASSGPQARVESALLAG